MQKSNTAFIITILMYTIVIVGVFLWSGQNKEKNLYDKYLISLQGASFSTTNMNMSKNFYQKVLEFDLRHEGDNEMAFTLPDKRVLNILNSKAHSLDTKGIILIRVRNGLYNLHEAFMKHLKEYENRQYHFSFSNADVSSIRNTKRGKEFDVLDPDGNIITFYQRPMFSRS
ncbi:MAG TPA: hypothetical protein PKA63_01005 [Oligoflexia bacterium]|nr:hypothetical protein [Oligoflexia bacterium]HMP47227.1 hypothetical protein [Oligoflexia bacterium]